MENGNSATKSQSMLSERSERLAALTEKVHTVTEKARIIADRLYGFRPEASLGHKEETDSFEHGSFRCLDKHLDDLEKEIELADDQVNRLVGV